MNKKLFWRARYVEKEKNYPYVSVRRGEIFSKKGDGGPKNRIACIADLGKASLNQDGYLPAVQEL